MKVSGEVLLDLIQTGELHNIFIATPETGRVTRASISRTSSMEPRSTNKIYNCYQRPAISSPDGKFLATCNGTPAPSMVGASPDIFSIAATNSIGLPCHGLRGKKIVGFLWSPDSKAVAVLSSTVHVSYNPRYWFYALSGHPVQYENYYLNVIDPKTLAAVSFEVPFQTNFGDAQLLKWRQP